MNNGTQPVYLVGDVREVLRTLDEKSVQTVVTSPPYWGLRDYGIDGQLGLEPTPELYVQHMVEIFAEVWRVLRDDGTLWLNLGDCYISAPPGNKTPPQDIDGNYKRKMERQLGHGENKNAIYQKIRTSGLKTKDLVGIPWRVALALQADGWFLRSDIIWSKPNPMPESVTDRPTKAHEYIFLLSKSKKYYYDADAIREPWKENQNDIMRALDGGFRYEGKHKAGYDNVEATGQPIGDPSRGRNKRTVWNVATKPYPGAHFAVFPDKLIEPCILAGSAPKACGICGAPWEREIEKGLTAHDGKTTSEYAEGTTANRLAKLRQSARERGGEYVNDTKTIGWSPTCDHDDKTGRSIVLDPFAGSGTTLLVSRNHGRASIGIDINPEYKALAEKRARLDVPDIFTFDEQAEGVPVLE